MKSFPPGLSTLSASDINFSGYLMCSSTELQIMPSTQLSLSGIFSSSGVMKSYSILSIPFRIIPALCSWEI